MPKSLTFIFIVFMIAKFYFKKICFNKDRMTSHHKIVINVDIGILLTCNFRKFFKTKFVSLKNRDRPRASRNFSISKETFWQGLIGLNVCFNGLASLFVSGCLQESFP